MVVGAQGKASWRDCSGFVQLIPHPFFKKSPDSGRTTVWLVYGNLPCPGRNVSTHTGNTAKRHCFHPQSRSTKEPQPTGDIVT